MKTTFGVIRPVIGAGIIASAGLLLPSGHASAGTAPTPPVRMNMDKVGSATVVCPGDEVTFTLTTRMLGGAPGLSLRDIQVTDSHLPGLTLVPGDAHFVASSDVGGDGILAFIDDNNDGKSDEEFVWTYTLTYTETGTNNAADSAFVYVNEALAFPDRIGAQDSWTVTVDPSACPEDTTTTTTTTTEAPTTTTQAETTTTAAGSGGLAPTSTTTTTTLPLGGALPATGTDQRGPVIAGVLALLLGGLGLVLGRRRTTA